MRRRGLYREFITGEIVWLLYELDEYVHVQSRSTGKVRKVQSAFFDVLYQWHAEVA